jgi:hypothetical protein
MAKSTLRPLLDLFEEGVARLNDLPTDPDEIAGVLEDAGVRGQCGNPWQCVLAQFIKEGIGNAPDGSTYELISDGFQFMISDKNVSFMWDLPEHLKTFIHFFDEGRYPHLIGSFSGAVWRGNPDEE